MQQSAQQTKRRAPYILPAAALLFVAVAAAWVWWTRPAAVVDGEVLRLADVDRRIALFTALYGHEGAALKQREARRRFTDMMIDELLLIREARRRNIAPQPGDVEQGYRALVDTLAGGDRDEARRKLRRLGVTEADVREFARRQATVNLLIFRVTADVRVLEKDVAAYYNEHKEEFQRPDVAHLRLIRVADPAAGERVLKALEQGRDFAALAREFSIDPATRSRDGDAGWVVRGDGRLEPALEAAAFALRPGQTSGVVQAGAGRWYIVRMEEYRPVRQFTLEEVRGNLQMELVRQKKEEAFEAFREGLRKKARVRTLVG